MIKFVLLLIVLNLVKNLDIEICEPFIIHHRFKNCPDILRRDPNTKCDNEGTWQCSKFKCFFPHPAVKDGFCLYGHVERKDCCTTKNVHFADMWFQPNGNSGTDWQWNIFNFDIKGNHGDITIEGELFENVYDDVDGQKMYIALALDFNETCITHLKLYINGSVVISFDSPDLDLYFLIFLRAMMEVDRESGNNEKVFFVGMSQVLPSDEDVMALFELGWNRDPETTILCYTTTIPFVDALADKFMTILNNCKDKVKTWEIIGIVFIVLFTVAGLVLLLFVILWFFAQGKLRAGRTKYLRTRSKHLDQELFLPNMM